MRIADDGFVYAEHTILGSIVSYIGKRRVFICIRNTTLSFKQCLVHNSLYNKSVYRSSLH
jgi:hypothetical protein